MIVWLLVAPLYVLDAMSPVIVVPNIASEQECWRLGHELVFRHSHEANLEIRCVSYQSAEISKGK